MLRVRDARRLPQLARICRKPIGLYVPKTYWLVYAENGVAPMCRKPNGLYVVKSDTKLGSSWFSQGMLKPGQPVKSISVPNAPGMGHQWSYLPDVARTMVELLQLRSTLDPFAAFHTAGHWDADGTQLAEAICRVVVKRGGVKPKVRAFPWWLTVLAAPFVPTLRELCQMRYLWSTRVKMSNAKLVSTLGHEPHTPLDEAVEAALEGMGCLQTTPVRKLSTVNSDG